MSFAADRAADAGGLAGGGPARRVLRLRPGLTLIPGGADDPATTWVRINSRVLRLRGEGTRQILSAMDGTRTLDEVAAVLGVESPDAVAAVVDRLRTFGLLEPDGCDAVPSLAPQVRVLADLGVDGAAVSSELARATVALVGEGVLAHAVRTALDRVGIRGVRTLAAPHPGSTAEPPPGLADVDVAVAALDPPDPDALSSLNALALSLEIPWLLLEARGFELRVGPFFLPRQTACWECYEARLDATAPAYHERRAAQVAQRLAGVPPAPADDLTPGTAAIGAEICALEVVRFFAARVSEVGPELHGSFADYSLLAHRAATHRVLRLPRCPACGPRAAGRPTVRAWMEPYDYPGDE